MEPEIIQQKIHSTTYTQLYQNFQKKVQPWRGGDFVMNDKLEKNKALL